MYALINTRILHHDLFRRVHVTNNIDREKKHGETNTKPHKVQMVTHYRLSLILTASSIA